jgi:hypothetical protein
MPPLNSRTFWLQSMDIIQHRDRFVTNASETQKCVNKTLPLFECHTALPVEIATLQTIVQPSCALTAAALIWKEVDSETTKI